VISVVIPVRDGADHLAEQLEALASQTYAGEWEVVVADNGSVDGTRECALVVRARLPGLPRLRVVDASGCVGVSHARNVGATAAAGEIVAFCDADDRVEPGWLDAIAAAMRGADGVGGAVDWVSLNPARVDRPGGAMTDRLLELRPRFLPFAPGGNCAVRTTVFHTLGGFDERYRGGGDDVEFFWRLQGRGHRLTFAPAARIAYRERNTVVGAAVQAYRWARPLPRLYREFRAQGMPRLKVRDALRIWRNLLARAPGDWVRPAGRRQWAVLVAERLGRIAGSVRWRVLYL
jgi:glycosyltransferase involved in cell wall biosynthesis